ncbi:hypothetical protein T05_15031 [Trichinella murrelli]|uniref:Uncharacterized protein n=1 Tax=Trichinella murrelli TaxID=144512 RepID=A0A0V0TA23_9BILA|nr:hypothetical protein T05_15031 [Trichinella murrelli]
MESSSHVRNLISIVVNPQKPVADFCVKITRPPTLAHSYGKTFEAREYA